MTQTTTPDHHAAMLDAMRRAIAASFAGCWNGNACPHPTRETCACLDAACLAFSGLTAYLAAPSRAIAAPEDRLALRLAILARRSRRAATAQPDARIP